MCNVNIQLEIKETISDFLKHLRESIYKLGLDVILTDFFFSSSHLLYQCGLDYKRDCCKSAARRIRRSEIYANFGRFKKNPEFNSFHAVSWHLVIFINSMKSCVVIYQKSVVLQGFWEFIESRRKIRVCLFSLSCLLKSIVPWNVYIDTSASWYQYFSSAFFFSL